MRGVRWRATWLLVAASASVEACALLTDVDGLTGEGKDELPREGGGPEASSADVRSQGEAAVDAAAGDVDIDAPADAPAEAAGPGLSVDNGDFEGPGAGCGLNWNPENALISRDGLAYGGVSSCRVCMVPDVDWAYFKAVRLIPLPPGAKQCIVSAWLRLSPGLDAEIPYGSVGIDWFDKDDNRILYQSAAEVAVGSAWVEYVHTVNVPANAVSAVPFVRLARWQGTAARCVLVDDVAFDCR
jgi:hypothetical protein